MSRRNFLAAMGATAACGWCRAVGTNTPAAPSVIPSFQTPREARFYRTMPDGSVTCELCPRGCRVQNGSRGFCRVRENRGGTYRTLVYGQACAAALDPIEKKPFFHVYPGQKAFSIATIGCNFQCKFCQNFDIAQSTPEDIQTPYHSPEFITQLAVERKARVLAFTYSEPTVFYEYVHDCARTAQKAGVDSIIISNGFINEAPQKTLFPYVKAIKIDLKSFSPSFYENICGGTLQPVLDTLKRLSRSGVWFEIVNLLIPTLNDNANDLHRMSAWIVKELGPDVPVHFTRFTPMYKLKNLPPTPTETLLMARDIAIQEGCHYAYCGNQPGMEGENTICPSCKKVVIQRYGFRILENNLVMGQCKFCKQAIPGVWA
jgi:pyruvate formate lyase activating enzyme